MIFVSSNPIVLMEASVIGMGATGTAGAHYFRTGPTQRKLKVDKEARTISDIVAIELGDIKDYRPWTINEEFLQDLTSLATKQKEGVMSNFGHNWNNLGKRLGRATNWRIEGNQVKYDLKIFETADKSPGLEKMGEYVMDMAIEDDKALMSSITFGINFFYQLDQSGKKLKVWYYDEKSGWVSHNPALGKVFPKIGELNSVDIVDEGAATNSLFSCDEEMIVLMNIINREGFIDKLEANYQHMPILANFFAQKNKPGLLAQIKDLFSPNPSVEDSPEFLNLQNNLHKMSQEKDQLTHQREQLTAENAELKKANEELTTKVTGLETKMEEFSKDLEALKNSPAAESTQGNEGNEEHADDSQLRSYQKNPLYLQARKNAGL